MVDIKKTGKYLFECIIAWLECFDYNVEKTCTNDQDSFSHLTVIFTQYCTSEKGKFTTKLKHADVRCFFKFNIFMCFLVPGHWTEGNYREIDLPLSKCKLLLTVYPFTPENSS